MTQSQFKELQLRRAMLLPFTRPQLTIQHTVFLPDHNPNWKSLQKAYDEQFPLGTILAEQNPQLDMPPNSEYDARLINPATERYWTEEELAETDLIEPDPVDSSGSTSDSYILVDPNLIQPPAPQAPIGSVKRRHKDILSVAPKEIKYKEHTLKPSRDPNNHPDEQFKQAFPPVDALPATESEASAPVAKPLPPVSLYNPPAYKKPWSLPPLAERKQRFQENLLAKAPLVAPPLAILHNGENIDRTPHRLIDIEINGTVIEDLRSDYINMAFYGRGRVAVADPKDNVQISNLTQLHDEIKTILTDWRSRSERWKFAHQYNLRHDDFEYSYRRTHTIIYNELKRITARLAILSGLESYTKGITTEVEGQFIGITEMWTILFEQNEQADPYLKRTNEELEQLMRFFFPHLQDVELKITKVRSEYNCGMLHFQKRVRPQIKSYRYTRTSNIRDGKILIFRAWPNGRMKDNITPPYPPHQALRKNFKVNITLDPNRGHRTPLPRRTGDPNKARYTIIRKEQEQQAALGVYTPTEQSTFDPRLQSIEEEPLD